MALIIDANTGRKVQRGDRFRNVCGLIHVLDVRVGLFSGHAILSIDDGPPQRVPLMVRWTHPSFFLRRVAFIPS